jgi:arylsulfatase A
MNGMKISRSICLLLTLSVLTLPGRSAQPNIVFILADDLGRECLEVYGGNSYQTPNLNQLAAEGTRFEACYATPMCSPTRVMLMTGRYSFHSYERWATMNFSSPTIGKLLQAAGYDTALFGKWHLGGWDSAPYGPTRAGFDRFATFDYEKVVREGGEIGNQFWKTEVWEEGRNFRLDGYSPAYYRDHALRFIREHEGTNNKPFFLYYPLAHAHRPFVPTDQVEATRSKRTVRNGDLKNFPAMVEYIDGIVGSVISTLKETGQLERTVIFFSADNGTDNVGEAKQLRSSYRGLEIPGGKYLPTELGANVPLIVRGPGIPRARVTRAPVDFTDMMPTLCSIAGIQAPDVADGEDLWPMLQGGPESMHDGLAYTWGVYEHSSRKYKNPRKYRDKIIHFIRDERWKLGSNGELFDLQNDWYEKAPLPHGIAAAARTHLEKHLSKLRGSETKIW